MWSMLTLLRKNADPWRSLPLVMEQR